ncbi:unnamed protein product [Adineta steineri]|uniref:Uncharacterized protein n=2 Tax=Adineta steineri TaxID=433720 RepID=A0A814TCV1_9BILA|nr:unnamed protein product [Adineta steineri]
MYRLLTFYILFSVLLFMPIDAAKKRTYTTGIADIVRTAFRRTFHHFMFRQTSYDSDVFRYTQLSQRRVGGLYAGESCRLSANICSHDEQCCSGRCICRRWSIMGEQRCIRKCF